MPSQLLAFAAACAFVGAALYVNLVEQPARLALDPNAILREWLPSYRRGSILMAILAIISALSGYAHYLGTGDVRWLIGGTIMLASLAYSYFGMTSLNILLYVTRREAPASAIRELIREWGLLEWGQTVIGVAACCSFGWAFLAPA